jgi:hypothetical protein
MYVNICVNDQKRERCVWARALRALRDGWMHRPLPPSLTHCCNKFFRRPLRARVLFALCAYCLEVVYNAARQRFLFTAL